MFYFSAHPDYYQDLIIQFFKIMHNCYKKILILVHICSSTDNVCTNSDPCLLIWCLVINAVSFLNHTDTETSEPQWQIPLPRSNNLLRLFGLPDSCPNPLFMLCGHWVSVFCGITWHF